MHFLLSNATKEKAAITGEGKETNFWVEKRHDIIMRMTTVQPLSVTATPLSIKTPRYQLYPKVFR